MSAPAIIEKTGEGVVVINYQDLVAGKDLSAAIEEAYGQDGHCLGILVVRGVEQFPALREKFVPLAQRYANLSDEIKAKTEHKKSNYNFGWSHGKEMLEDGKPDKYKGSYYANPIYDVPTTDQNLIDNYPEYCAPNIWPTDLPEMETGFKELGRLIYDVGLLVAKHCDLFVQKNSSKYIAGAIYKTLENSRSCKARMLHYFPKTVDDIETDSSKWCGWHLDHGSLTGLCSAMYLDQNLKQVPIPDTRAGLYIRNRAGNEIKAVIPKDSIAYQIGETSQIMSGGLLRATPHCVLSPAGRNCAGIGRNTYVVFMQPNYDDFMEPPEGTKLENIGNSIWKPHMDFKEFTKYTIAKYYQM